MINLSTRGRYAARILVNLAQSKDGQAKNARTIAREENIALDYAEQLLLSLRTAGFVRSRRGSRGGFALQRPAEKIRMADLLERVEGDLSLVPCIDSFCERRRACPTRKLWKEAGDAMRGVFAKWTIADLAEQ